MYARSAVVFATMLMAVACRGDGPPDAPYQPDEHTLFLHHFDGNTTADFARGAPQPLNPPGDRQFVAGVFGQAIVFTKTERQLTFATEGNYNPARGTIEFFVREPDLAVGGFASNRGYWQTQGGQALREGAAGNRSG